MKKNPVITDRSGMILTQEESEGKCQVFGADYLLEISLFLLSSLYFCMCIYNHTHIKMGCYTSKYFQK